MTNQEISQQLNEEFNKFQDSTYDPKTDLDLVALFKKCYMNLGLQQHKISSIIVKEIVNAKEGKLTVVMYENLFKVLLNVPMNKLFSSYDDAISFHSKIEKYVGAYNKYVDDFKIGLQIKSTNLKTISNPSKSNGMRIIPQA